MSRTPLAVIALGITVLVFVMAITSLYEAINNIMNPPTPTEIPANVHFTCEDGPDVIFDVYVQSAHRSLTGDWVITVGSQTATVSPFPGETCLIAP